jgi:hypothetical protein
MFDQMAYVVGSSTHVAADARLRSFNLSRGLLFPFGMAPFEHPYEQ